MTSGQKFVDKYDSARPYIAGFVILRRDNMVAMILRKNTGYMDGFYGLPSGKVEYHEQITKATIREALEEAGVTVKEDDLRFVHVVHRHGLEDGGFMDWVDVYFEAEKWQGEPYNAEEHKSEKLEWLNIDNLPENIVPPQLAAIKEIKTGSYYSEYGWIN